MDCFFVMGRYLIILLISLLATPFVNGQYYHIGQEPWSTKWEEAVSSDYKIIYPVNYRKSAYNTLLYFEKWGPQISKSLNVTPPFTPVILHTGSSYSNAFAIWAPRRMEFLTIPPQNIYAQPWLEQLVLHEYRHIAQISKVNQGFTKFLGYLFGEQAAPAVLGLFVPPWFMEGDAVATETALSFSGRGRLANFAMPLRAQVIEKGYFPYSKAVLGSYRDFVPDEYVLGYHIVAYARAEYSNQIWNTALELTGKRPYLLNPFSKGIRKVSSQNKKGLYIEAMNNLNNIWAPSSDTDTTGYLVTKRSYKVHTNYFNPFIINDKVLALKSSLSDIPSFVEINRLCEEKRIHTPGYLFTSDISSNGTWLSWIEQRPHMRWENQVFSTIVLLNASTHEVQRIKTNLRVFSPVVNYDNSVIATSEVSTEGDFYLTLLDLSGKILKRIKHPTGDFISSPTWSPDGNEIACILTTSIGKQLITYSFTDSTFSAYSPITINDISNPFHTGEGILFNMDIDERSEVFFVDISTNQVYRLTNSTYGTANPSLSNGKLVYQEYTSDGYRIKIKESIDYSAIVDLNEIYNDWPLADAIYKEEKALLQKTDTVASDSIEVRKYSRASDLINIHSWAPLYINIDNQELYPGVSVMSQNLLSTLFVTAGYEFNLEEEEGKWKVDINWEGWFPRFHSSLSYGNRSAWTGTGDSAYRMRWKETTWDLGISQALQTVSGKFNIGIIATLSHQLTRSNPITNTSERFIKGSLGASDFRLAAFIYNKQAHRDLAPRSGARIDFHYKKSLYGEIKAGDLSSVQTRIYLPGLVKNHSLQIYGAVQDLNTSGDGYRFSGDIGLPAGYNERVPSSLVRLRPSYSFPVCYPDISVGTFYYLKRLRANIFYDIAKGGEKSFESIGIDAITDFHLFSLPYPISMGVRSEWLPVKDNWEFSLILNYDLTQY